MTKPIKQQSKQAVIYQCINGVLSERVCFMTARDITNDILKALKERGII